MRTNSAVILACLMIGLFSTNPLISQASNSSRAKSDSKHVAEGSRTILRALEKHRIDPALDSFQTISEKRAAVGGVLDGFATQTISHMLDMTPLGCDYARYWRESAPRLSGRVVQIGPEQEFKSLRDAADSIERGDLILLGEGVFETSEHRHDRHNWRDVAFVGLGPKRTTLKAGLSSARRVRFESLHIDCDNSPFLDTYHSPNSSAQVFGCRIDNYNSGAGGSNAVFTQNATMLFDDCVFEGYSGRAGKRGSCGNAFDLRGTNFLYVRDTTFLDNSEILRARSLSAFDRCRSKTDELAGSEYGISINATGNVLVRDSRLPVRPQEGRPAREFEVATDDADFVEHLISRNPHVDAKVGNTLQSLGLERSPTYWITLTANENIQTRQFALAQVTALLRDLPPKTVFDKEQAKAVPQELLERFKREVRTSQLLNWYDDNVDKLKWSEEFGHYEIQR